MSCWFLVYIKIPSKLMANWQKSSHEVIQLENGAETQTCFPGEDIQMTIQMTNEDTRRCSEPLANQQMQTEATKTKQKKNEATLGCQCTCNRMVKINNRAKR